MKHPARHALVLFGSVLLACAPFATTGCGSTDGRRAASEVRRPAPRFDSAEPSDARSIVVLLGTGTPNADPDRSGPATAVVVGNQAYLVDCGPGIVRRAAAAARDGVSALEPRNLDIVFLTHLHSDHTLGLPDLLFTPWVLEREKPLRVYGPPGTRAMVERVTAAWAEDVALRLDGLEPANSTGHRAIVTEIAPGVVFQDDRVKVTAFPVKHGSWEHAYGFRFDAPGRSIVISGDTAPCEALVEAATGCDLLVHEVYSAERLKTRPIEWQRYHKAFHTSTTELAELARRARPGLLILTHQLFWGATDEDLLREIAAIYDGPVAGGRDLGRY